MIEVLVTVGIAKEFPQEDESVKISLPCLPRIGDCIFPNEELKTLIEERREAWKYDKDCSLNYVRTVGYMDGQELPVIMIGKKPETIIVTLHYKDIWVRQLFHINAKFKENDPMYDPRLLDKILYIHDVYENEFGYSLFLEEDKKKEEPLNVNITNSKLPVLVRNSQLSVLVINAMPNEAIPVWHSRF